MAIDTGAAPTLDREDLQGVAETNRAAIYEGSYPVSQLFQLGGGGDLILSSSQKILLDMTRAMRRLGKWHSNPSDGDPLEYVRIGLRAAQVLYKTVTDTLPPNHAALLRTPGMPQSGMMDPAGIMAAAEAEALRWLNTFIDAGTRQHLRDFEQLCINLLTTATFTLTVDDYDDTVTTGLNVGTCPGGVAWTDASADIPADLARMVVAFEQSAGAPPDVIIYSNLLQAELALNTAVRAIVNSGKPVYLPITELPIDVMPATIRDATLIRHTDIIDSATDTDGAPTQTNMWPHYSVTMLSLRSDPLNVLRAYTVGTIPDGYRGGLWSRVMEEGIQRRTVAGVGFNAAPLTVDTARIMTWDVSTVEEEEEL